MRLWSYQGSGFSLIDGVYVPENSEWYQSNPRYKVAYDGLWDRVGCKNLVWCSTSEQNWPKRCEWVLEVPEASFLKIVDSMVWNGILGNDTVGPSGCFRDALLAQGMREAPHDPYGWCDAEVEQMLHPPGNAWESLFLSDANDPKANILLKHPIEQSWVISTKLH